jgi:hypothetical protein
MSNSIGRIQIAMQGAVQELEFTSESECDEFLDDLSRTLPERLRQNLLTWRANYHDRECTKQRDIADSVAAVSDDVKRERERVAARRGMQ